MARVVWTKQARSDLRAIRSFIAEDNPRNAKRFAAEIRTAVEALKRFPDLGAIVPEFDNPKIREIIKRVYRVIYRYQGRTIVVATVFHGARRLGELGFPE